MHIVKNHDCNIDCCVTLSFQSTVNSDTADQAESANAFLVGTGGLATCLTDKHFHLVNWQYGQIEKNPQ